MRTLVAPLLKSSGTAITKPGRPEGEEIFWLDELLRGGIHAPTPDQLGRPLIILLSGPPGAGKSLLLQQICHNVALRRCEKLELGAQEAITSGTSLYITTEASAVAVLKSLNAGPDSGMVKGPETVC